MRTRDHIIRTIDAFIAETGMTAARFGMAAVNDHKFLRRLKEQGKGITLTSIERAEEFMDRHRAELGDANRPADAA